MARAKKRARKKVAPPPKARQSLPRWLPLVGVLGLVGALLAGALLWRSGDSDGAADTSSAGLSADPGPVHVHGLGINPADEALFIATHTGLYRVGSGERKARRVGDSLQDTMGFTIAGPNRFLGSGHPDAGGIAQGLPPHLGLIESSDAGVNWENVSLRGEADFHVLRFLGERVYGYDASNDRLLVSADGGRTWTELAKPGPLVDLAVDPTNERRIVGTTQGGFFESRNGGGTWRGISPTVGLLAWPAADRLYLVNSFGDLLASRDGGRHFERRGDIVGQPAALLAQNANELYVALHDGTIKRSRDGGRTWTVRSTP